VINWICFSRITKCFLIKDHLITGQKSAHPATEGSRIVLGFNSRTFDPNLGPFHPIPGCVLFLWCRPWVTVMNGDHPMSIRALIVDDEPLARERLVGLLARESDVKVIGECRDGHEAVESIRALNPDLVFLDIQMPELDGFEVLKKIDLTLSPHIVFVTAFDHYAIKAFSFHALDYLLKPITLESLNFSLQRCREALKINEMQSFTSKISELLNHVNPSKTFLRRFRVEDGERTLFLRAEEVECIEATGNYMHLYRGNSSYIIRSSLNNLEKKLDPARFIRSHRSWILNVDRAKELHPVCKGNFMMVMQGGMKVPVSPFFRRRLDQVLEGIS